jgi:hypothetical protein
MNSLDDPKTIGAIGELLVQIRLLQYGVQAAPPIKDTGNDLIAVKEDVFKAIQVKTTTGNETPKYKSRDREYHLLAIVQLMRDENSYFLDPSSIFLVPWGDVDGLPANLSSIDDRYKLTQRLVDRFFG